MKIVWDRAGEHFYETGVDHGVLFPTKAGAYQKGVPWNGLTGVTESPSGAESTAQYADNIKYLNLISAEEFGATVEAFTYPPEFAVCDGSAEPVRGVRIGQQTRRPFGMSYRTLKGNDLEGTEYGYLLHIIYGATASPSERAYTTVNDSPEAITFSWTLTTTPVEVPGYKPTASLTIDSTMVTPQNMAALEAILYGTDTEESRLPMPAEVIALVGSSSAITLTVASPSSSTQVKGKSVSALQQNIVVSGTAISGKLLYVEGYTGYSSTVSEQEGNYLALKVTTDPADTTTVVELLGGRIGEQTPDSNGVVVMRVTNINSQTVRITSTKDRDSNTKVYTLTGLQLDTTASVG